MNAPTQPFRAAQSLRRLILAGFFLSGVAGLLYQSLWIRMLTLVMGGTTAALTTVLIAFMGGLALGSALFGRYADKTTRPIRAYALIEGTIGLYAMLLPLLYAQVPQIYRLLHAVDASHGVVFQGLRFGLALLFFGFPATLMGGTLPLIISACARFNLSAESREGLEKTVASAYAINTFGATLGAFLSGFVVIPTLGLTLTLELTGAFNLLLGVIFYRRFRSQEGDAAPAQTLAQAPASTHEPGSAPDASESPSTPALPRAVMLTVFFLMGASSLSYEILWHRLLGLSFGSSVYAVSTMLTTFLLGIALGSWWWRKSSAEMNGRGPGQGWATLGWIEVGIALSGPLTALALSLLPHLVQYLFLLPYISTQLLGPGATDPGFWGLQLCLFVVGSLVMLVPTSLMGASFPLAVRLYTESRREKGRDSTGQGVGEVYASNTFGSIVGLALTGFVLIQHLGGQTTVTLWNVLNALIGIGLLLSVRRRVGRQKPASVQDVQSDPRPWWQCSSGRSIAVALALLGLTHLLPGWNLETLTSGVYYHTLGARDGILGGRILFTEEDDLGLVSLHETHEWDQPEPTRTMKFNGKFMGADGQRLPVLHQFAHLPLFLHGPGAEKALVIGLGGGYTVEAALAHPLKQVDVVEISHGVIDAAHLTRPKLFNDPRLHVIEEDARSLVLTSPTRYDVIISETSDPWMTGVSNLYTVEFFRWVKERLAPGGVFGTWLQVRHKRVEDVRTIFATKHAAFPHMAVAQLTDGDTLLLMANEPLTLDAAFVKERFAALGAEFAALNLHSPFQVLGSIVLDEASLDAYVQGAAINTDDLPGIEFKTPRSLNVGLKGEEVRADLIAHAPETLSLPFEGLSSGESSLWHAYRALQLKQPDKALHWLEKAEAEGRTAESFSKDAFGLLKATALFRLDRYEEALTLVRSLPPSPRQALLEAGCLTLLGRLTELETQLKDAPGWPQVPTLNPEQRIDMRRKLLRGAVGG